jgi:hypothetical protein
MRVLPFTTTGGCWSVRVSLWQLRKMKVVLGMIIVVVINVVVGVSGRW